MALSPDKLLEDLGVEASQKADDFEQRLDAHLQQHWDGESTYVASIEGYLNKRTRHVIEQRYIQAGWGKVTWPGGPVKKGQTRVKLHKLENKK